MITVKIVGRDNTKVASKLRSISGVNAVISGKSDIVVSIKDDIAVISGGTKSTIKDLPIVILNYARSGRIAPIYGYSFVVLRKDMSNNDHWAGFLELSENFYGIENAIEGDEAFLWLPIIYDEESVTSDTLSIYGNRIPFSMFIEKMPLLYVGAFSPRELFDRQTQ
ncbi:hypothetical protein GQ42DRAFT_161039 [Ramicandelaber brevisporus]|nr:hypothetical protein GQ42DRAFT_161039 [Ramicandelaber brevisporus]